MIRKNLTILLLLIHMTQIYCHGRLLVPPARSSAWREDPVRFPVNYEDNEMFCGGFNTQWHLNNGKCGICGEDYSAPKKYEKNGELYRGSIVRSYTEAGLMDVTVELNANHLGYFEFRVCNVDNLAGDATQECLDRVLLADLTGNTKILVSKGAIGLITITLRLPNNFSCDHCVLQWKYNTANSWNTDLVMGKSCVGCGPQEQFYGCSDVAIIQLNNSKSILSSSSTKLTKRIFKRNTAEKNPKAEATRSLLKRIYDELVERNVHDTASSNGEAQAEQQFDHHKFKRIELDVSLKNLHQRVQDELKRLQTLEQELTQNKLSQRDLLNEKSDEIFSERETESSTGEAQAEQQFDSHKIKTKKLFEGLY